MAIRIVICSSVRKIAVTPQQRATAAFGNKWNVQLDSSLAVTTLKPLEETEMKKLIVCGALAGAMTVDAAVTGACEAAESQTPVLGVAVPYAIANVVLTVLGPIIVALTFVG